LLWASGGEMYAVIFRATVNTLDREYSATVERLHVLAQEYGCRSLHSVMQGDEEVTLSYWDDLEQIKAWRQDPEHRKAQELGRSRWYAHYEVQICPIERGYSWP